jgi:hypothetical protein
MSGHSEGHHAIARASYRELDEIFDRYLPGWKLHREYNYVPTVNTPLAAKQLGVLLQSGDHPGIRGAIVGLVTGSDFRDLSDEARTKALARLVEFMREAGESAAEVQACRRLETDQMSRFNCMIRHKRGRESHAEGL